MRFLRRYSGSSQLGGNLLDGTFRKWRVEANNTKKNSEFGSAIHIHEKIPFDELHDIIVGNPKLDFIHVNHSAISKSANDNIISLSKYNSELKRKLILLANATFHLYALRGGVSSMVRHRRIPTLWKMSKSGEVSVDENLIFSTLKCASGAGEPRLLVVFSSIAGKMYTPSLVRHFEQNFASIEKYVPTNTHILRIVDFGGVVGSFYLDSNALPQNERNIHSRILASAEQLGVKEQNIVLYGTSKGGTAASFYAMRHGWRAVAVDPILSDDHYVQKHGDSHFTLGTFPAAKEVRFSEIVREVHPSTCLSVICSELSPQFPYISETLIDLFQDRFAFLNSKSCGIKSHPDVGPKTLPHTLSQLNQHLAGLDISAGLYNVW